jgi:hypothetical protein
MTGPDDRFRRAEGDLTDLSLPPAEKARLDAEFDRWSRTAGAALVIIATLAAIVAASALGTLHP